MCKLNFTEEEIQEISELAEIEHTDIQRFIHDTVVNIDRIKDERFDDGYAAGSNNAAY